jgi:benzoylformate decarboxylase
VPYNASFPTDHPSYQGMLTRSQENVRATLEPYDLILCLGADLLRMSVYSPVEPLPAHARVLHLSERPWELGKNYNTEAAIAANVRETLRALLPVLHTHAKADDRAAAQQRNQSLTTDNWTQRYPQRVAMAQSQAAQRPLTAPTMLWHLTRELPREVIVVEEALTSTHALPHYLRRQDPDSFFGLASGGLGFAIPGAVGISLAKPGRPVLAVVGDGSAMYSIQGLWTAAHLKLPITYVITNNRSYRIIKERLVSMQQCDTFIGMDMRDPAIDFCQLAGSMGIEAHRITEADDITPALQRALASGRPQLIEIMMADGFGQ